MPSLTLERKIEILAERYRLSSSGVFALAVNQMWEKKAQSDQEIYKADLVQTFLDKNAELEILRAKLEEVL